MLLHHSGGRCGGQEEINKDASNLSEFYGCRAADQFIARDLGCFCFVRLT